MASYESAVIGTDEYYTPKYVFDALETSFDLDAASPVNRTYCHVPAKSYITENSLEKQWFGFVWLNPPFSGRNSKTLWLDKMKRHGSGIVLTPDRTSAPWWNKAAKEADAVFFISPGKVQFILEDGAVAKSPSTGVTLFGYGFQAVTCLLRAERNGLGITLKRF